MKKVIELKEIDTSVFQAALDFQCCGQLSPAVIEGDTQQEHPLLQLADLFDLQDLKKDYLDLASQKVPLTASTAAWHLTLAGMVNDEEMKAQCIRLLANNFGHRDLEGFLWRDKTNQDVLKQFLNLSPEDARAVLGHDELRVPDGREREALAWFRQWVEHQPKRALQATELLHGVRLDLLSVQDIVDFHEHVRTNSLWMGVKDQMCNALCTAMNKKLSLVSFNMRKRTATVLGDGEDEKNLIKVLRITKSMWEVTPAVAASCGA